MDLTGMLVETLESGEDHDIGVIIKTSIGQHSGATYYTVEWSDRSRSVCEPHQLRVLARTRSDQDPWNGLCPYDPWDGLCPYCYELEIECTCED